MLNYVKYNWIVGIEIISARAYIRVQALFIFLFYHQNADDFV